MKIKNNRETTAAKFQQGDFLSQKEKTGACEKKKKTKQNKKKNSKKTAGTFKTNIAKEAKLGMKESLACSKIPVVRAHGFSMLLPGSNTTDCAKDNLKMKKKRKKKVFQNFFKKDSLL